MSRGRAGFAVVALALLALGGGVTAWWQLTRGAAPREAPLPPPEVIERALAQVETDSLALKTRWVETVPDAGVEDLTAAQRETFVRFVNARFCECGCGYTLGACRNFDPTCPYSGPLVEALADSIRAGHRFDAAGIRPRPGTPEG
jgi:hypothetical protein